MFVQWLSDRLKEWKNEFQSVIKGTYFFISSWIPNIHSSGNMITNLSGLHSTVGPGALCFNKLLKTSLRIEAPSKPFPWGWGGQHLSNIKYQISLHHNFELKGPSLVRNVILSCFPWRTYIRPCDALWKPSYFLSTWGSARALSGH